MTQAYQYIKLPAQLEKVCNELSGAKEIAVDFEFDDNRFTYGRTLCLVQVATRNACYIIDPLLVKDCGSLWQIIANPSILKVLHSATQDIYLMKENGCQPRNLLDTEVAAKILNYERTSFAAMLETILGLTLDKDQQTSNWTKRPLTDAQLNYAALDVLHLLELKDILVTQIQEKGRTPWLAEECKILEEIEPADNLTPHLKLKDAVKLSPFSQYLLQAMFSWRDAIGRQFNQPGARIISNAVLVGLAESPIKSLADWERLPGVFGPIRKAPYSDQFLQVIEQAQTEASAKGLAKKPVFRPRTPRVFSQAEYEQCNLVLSAIRQQLIQTYGNSAIDLLLTSGMIKKACQGPALIINKKYAFNLISETAAALQLQVDQFLKYQPKTTTTE